jgi:hypothetical protein
LAFRRGCFFSSATLLPPVRALGAIETQEIHQIVHRSGFFFAKTALILVLSCASLSLAQDPKPSPQPAVVKRLASVTWDLNTHKLVWVIQKGAEVDGAFVPLASDRYEVSPEEAFMASKNEKRGLGDEEAGSVIDLVNLLSLYCAESTDWWEQGSSTEESAVPKSEQKGVEPKTPATPNGKPTHVGEPDRKTAPAPRMPGTLVAANSPSGNSSGK